MKSKLLQIWSRLRSSYWFVPTVMAVGAIVLSLVTIEADRRLGGGGAGFLRGWVSPDPAGARAFLTTVAGSMITVAGVVFSITMVALTLASSQFGSRLLESFMRDRGNQVVLGTFIATFLYCMLVLRAPEVGEPPRVSELSLAVALLLTLGSLAVLIYFIHHAAVSIQVPNLAAEVARELERAIAGLTGGDLEPLGAADRERVREVRGEGRALVAQRSAYIDSYDADTLYAVARKHGLLVVCVNRPGRFAVAGRPLLRVLPQGQGGLDGEVEDDLRGGVLLSHRRRPEGDVEFHVEQLVELAVRALSPGINDPFTAMNCTDLLAAALARFAEDPPPPPRRRDDDGELRLVLPQVTLEDLLDVAFHQIRQYGRGCAAVTLRLLERMADLAACARTEEDLEAVLRHAEMVRRGGVEALPEPRDREVVEERWRWVQGVARREGSGGEVEVEGQG